VQTIETTEEIDAMDVYSVEIRKIINAGIPTRSTIHSIPKIAPSAVAIPFPPLNPKNGENTFPRTTEIAKEHLKKSKEMYEFKTCSEKRVYIVPERYATVKNDFETSISNVNIPYFHPSTLFILVAPGFPLPKDRMFTPFNLEMISPDGVPIQNGMRQYKSNIIRFIYNPSC
jgi:hypothetical protein